MRGPGLIARTSRYSLVGVACAVVNNAILIGGDLAGFHYFTLTLVCFFLVTPFGYLLHCSFTFGKEPSLHSFLRFVGGVALAYPLSLALVALFCSGFGLRMVLAAPLATLILFLFNYVSAHWAIVRRLRLS